MSDLHFARARAPRARSSSAHVRAILASAVERLEPRQLFAAGIGSPAGTLELNNYKGTSNLTVRRYGDVVRITEDAGGKVVAAKPADQVAEVRVNVGKRQLTVALAGGAFAPDGVKVAGEPNRAQLVVTGTPGDDVFRLAGNRVTVNQLAITLVSATAAGVAKFALNGKAGNDTYGLDRTAGVVVNDPSGTELLDFSTAGAGVTVNLGSGPFNGIENLTGSPFGDKLTGSSAANVIRGNRWNDTITGGPGADTIELLAGEGTDTVTDYKDGTDKVKLVGGLTYAELAVNQVGGDTVVSVDKPTLVGFASLPADSFGPGPTSGQFTAGANGVATPFANAQPIQGFSAVRKNGDGTYWAMSDNGYGSKANSADFLLRLHRLRPDFRSVAGGTAGVQVLDQITLSDPNHKINFPIVADAVFYPNGSNNVPVDPAIKAGRLLTGADFDIESFRVVADGTIWFGDEFGPFLIHTDAAGRVLDAPIALAGVQSPDNPFLGASQPTLGRSRGFEGMALNASGTKLYPSIEGALTADADQTRRTIYEFDLATKQYTGLTYQFKMEAPGNSIGDLTAVNDTQFLVIERDNEQGAAAKFKKVFLLDLTLVDASGFLVKKEVADLLNVADPNDLDANGSKAFTFPFQTIEDVEVIDPWTIGVLDDNNFPFSSGRTPGKPDNNEFVLIGLSQPLAVPAGAPLPAVRGTSAVVLKHVAPGAFTIADTVSTAPRPLILGHRGSAGYLPEHTLEGYALAIKNGADYIEPDLVITKDGVLIARHEPVLAAVNPATGAVLERTTDVNEHAEFAGRRTTKVLDGTTVTGWFAEDFTLAEIKTLYAVERLPFRSHANDYKLRVPTFQEVVDLAQATSTVVGRTIGLYPETKHPTYFDAQGKSLEEPLVAILRAEDLDDADDRVFIQSFEVSNLIELNGLVNTPIVQLMDASGRPYDFTAKGDARTYADLATPAGLAFVSTYADGIGPNKRMIVPATPAALLPATTLVRDAHAAGLLVHPFTFRNEAAFPTPAGPFLHPAYGGNPAAEYEQFFALGVDGLFTDFVDTARSAADRLYPYAAPDPVGGIGLAK